LNKLPRLNFKRNIIISETIIPDKRGRKICASGLLKTLNEKGINTIILSSNYGLGVNEEIRDLVLKGVPFVEKTSSILGEERRLYDKIIRYFNEEDLVA
jgi:hypothetical protein